MKGVVRKTPFSLHVEQLLSINIASEDNGLFVYSDIAARARMLELRAFLGSHPTAFSVAGRRRIFCVSFCVLPISDMLWTMTRWIGCCDDTNGV